MLCLACASVGYPLCHRCDATLRSVAPLEILGTAVHAAFAHTGAAVRLVHNLKYRRSSRAGFFLAAEMAERVPGGVDVLVPIPRVLSRRISHGIDQTSVLAACVSRLTGIRVVPLLAAPLWHRRLAGSSKGERKAPRFRVLEPMAGKVLLVDDVCTTGATIASAAEALKLEDVSALVATSAFVPTPTSPQRWS